MASPSVTVIGNFESLTGASTGYIRVTLAGYGAQIPRVSGTGILAPLSYTSSVAASFSVTLWGNDVLSPTNATYYLVSIYNADGSNVVYQIPYQFTGSGTLDLSTLTPIGIAPPPPLPIPSTVGANLFAAGPSSGGPGPMTYRSIVTADVQGVAVVDSPTAPQTVTGQTLNLVSAPLVLDAASPLTVPNATITNATVTTASVKTLNNVFKADQFPGANAGAKIQAAITAAAALGAQGSVIDARGLIGAQTISSSITVNVPVTILFGYATYTITSGVGANPAFNVTSPVNIIGVGQSVPAGALGFTPSECTVFQAGSGWTGQYVIGISTSAVGAYGTAANSSVRNIVCDGNLGVSSGVQIISTFGVTIEDVSFMNPLVGVNIQAPGTNAFSEGSRLNRVFISNPADWGIALTGGVANASVANANWGSIWVSLFTAGSVAILTDANAAFKNSHVDYVKVWMNNTGGSPVTETALQVGTNMDGTVFDSFNIEVQTVPGGSTLNGILVSPSSVNMPSILNYVTQGGTVVNTLGVATTSLSTRQLTGYLSQSMFTHFTQATIGKAQVAGNIALSAGWGTTATVTAVSGTSQRMQFTVNSSGTGQAANPTITITFAETWPVTPFMLAKMVGGTGAITTVASEGSASTTSVALTFIGTPAAGSTYIFNCIGF
jgi:hypothetical protein